MKQKILKYRGIAILLMFLLSGVINGQSVDQLINDMNKSNSTLKGFDKRYDASKYGEDQVILYPELQVSAGFGVLPIETRLGAQRFTLGVMQMLPTKGMYNAKRTLASNQSEVLSEGRNISTKLLEEKIKVSYYELQFLELKRKIFRDKIDQLQTLAEIAQINIRSGKGRLSNLIFVERQIQMVSADLELIENEAQVHIISINSLLERETALPIDIDMSNWMVANEYLEPDMGNQPLIRMMQKMKKVSESKIKLTELDSKLKFSVGLNYAFISARDDMNPEHNGRDMLMPVASVKIPLTLSNISAKTQEEKLIQESIDLNIEGQKRAFQSEWTISKSRIDLAIQTIAKYEKLIATSEDIVELMKTEYATEGRKFEELLRVELEILDYQLEQHKQQLIIKKAIAAMEKYNQ